MKADQSQQFVRTIEIKDRTGRVIGSKDVITYQGLLSKAHDEGLKRIHTTLVQTPNDENARTAIAKAEVETEKGCFQALGDASPESVTPFLIPHLIRMAETRAKARALRDAVNVGVISFEELDGEDLDGRDASDLGSGAEPPPSRSTRNGNNGSTARSRGNGPARTPRATNGAPELMSEAQRRYLFRLIAGQGFHKEAAEEHLKDLMQVDSLTAVTKPQATELIDELLKDTAPRSGERSGTANP